MTQQPESRWSLNYTGNRVMLAVVIGLAVAFLCGGAGLAASAELVLFALVVAIAYLVVTALHRIGRR